MTGRGASENTGSGTPAPGPERLAVVVPVAVLCAAWSYFYGPWKLPPQLPFGTVGLILGGDVLPLAVAPALVIAFVLRRPFADYGLRWPGLGRVLAAGGLAWAVTLPLAVWLARRPEFQAFYPSPAFPPAREHWIGLLFLWTLHHVPQLFSVELCLRGFLSFPLIRALGLPRALVAQLALYVWLHASKPPLELGLAAWGGLAFTLAAWRTGSIWPAFLAHWGVAVTIDAISFMTQRGN